MADTPPSVMIISGEASGDLHGASLVARLREMVPGIEIRGIGGRRMRDAGVSLLYDSSSWSAIGITEALKLVPRLLLVLRRLRAHLNANPPDVLILIDFGAFNVRVARGPRPPGTKLIYYFPPGSWHRGATYQRLQGSVDRVVTPFPWSVETLRGRGIQADYFGHPLLDIVSASADRDTFCEQYGFNPNHPIVGLLPGSRVQEMRHNLPALLLTAARMMQSSPDLQFAVPVATSVDISSLAKDLASVPWVCMETTTQQRPEKYGFSRLGVAGRFRSLAAVEKYVPSARVKIKLLSGMAWDVLAHSRAAIVSSGTATVEAMIMGCPMVIMYRGSRLTALEYKLLGRKIKYIGMPNIILDRMACPELIQENASSSRMSELMLRLIQDTPEREKMLRDFSEAKTVLGSPGAVVKTAEVVVSMMGEGK